MKRNPYVFIGSSSEGLKYAEALQLNFDGFAEMHIWSQGLFGLSDGTFETLIKSLDKFDFAILILTGDDLTFSRSVESQSPRDNVIFELGLFIGGLGRSRVYIVVNEDAHPKLPSDLAGITVARFSNPTMGNLQTALGATSTRIKDKISEIGLREKVIASESNYDKDLEMIIQYLKDRGYTSISIESLAKWVHPKFDNDHILKIIEANPEKIRRTVLSDSRPGIKLLKGVDSQKTIWREKFGKVNNWNLNYWGSKKPDQTNRIENDEMIFEAEKDDLEHPSGYYGAFVDINVTKDKTYLVRCKVRSAKNTTMGFQLWLHDTKPDISGTSVFRPVLMETPPETNKTITASFVGTDSNTMRIHLHCKTGKGQIKVSEVTVVEVK